MGKYKVQIKKNVHKDIAKIPKKDVKKMAEIFIALEDNPRPPGAKMLSFKNFYCLRYRSYRIIYNIQDNILMVFVFRVGHRKDVYRF